MQSKRLIPLRHLSFLVILSFWTTTAVAATWYVNVATGNDSNNGTSPSTPFKWITKAMGGAAGVVPGVAISGDTISVAPGTYPWATPPC